MAQLIRNFTLVRNAPIRVDGPVVKGFQRGRELGWPTANIDPKTWNHELQLTDGVYFGWAAIQSDHTVRKAVLSLGTNPTFGNKAVSLEVYICHDFERDFYGEELRLVICGYLRPQVKISWDDLIAAITEDVSVAKNALDNPQFSVFQDDDLFKSWPDDEKES